jgi:large repetitive protein
MQAYRRGRRGLRKRAKCDSYMPRLEVLEDRVQPSVVSVSTPQLEVFRGGAAASFSVVLTSAPASEVDIALTVDDANAATDGTTINLDQTQLAFTPSDWSTPQTVNVSSWSTGIPLPDVLATIDGTTSSGDPNFDAQTMPPIAVTATDGVAVSTNQLTVEEGGASAAYTIALTTQPTANVTVSVDNTGTPLTITPATVTFTADNWSIAQTVTVTAPVGAAGPYGTVIVLNESVTSDDPNYAAVSPPSISVTVQNNPAYGIVLSTDNVQVTRGGDPTSFTVALPSQPAADVTITIAQSDGDPLQMSPTTLTFTPANWNTPQTVTVGPPATGAGDQYEQLTFTATSDDPNFANAGLPSISVSVIDPAAALAGLVFSKQTLSVTPGGAGDSYTIALASQPSADVTVTISQGGSVGGLPMPTDAGGANPPVSADGSLLTITPMTLTFTPDNWSSPQTVTVTAAAGTGDAGTLPQAWLVHTVTSNDPNYNSLAVGVVWVNAPGGLPPILTAGGAAGGPPTPAPTGGHPAPSPGVHPHPGHPGGPVHTSPFSYVGPHNGGTFPWTTHAAVPVHTAPVAHSTHTSRRPHS